MTPSIVIFSRKAAMAAAFLLTATGCQTPAPSPEQTAPSPTRLASIAVAAPDGTVIVLNDRSTWVIAPEHRALAGTWRTADLVEANPGAAARANTPGSELDAFPATLTNQETGSSVRAQQSADFGG